VAEAVPGGRRHRPRHPAVVRPPARACGACGACGASCPACRRAAAGRCSC
jgi:heterodisulfide reductase subunit C